MLIQSGMHIIELLNPIIWY